jgi:hypothetical protein
MKKIVCFGLFIAMSIVGCQQQTEVSPVSQRKITANAKSTLPNGTVLLDLPFDFHKTDWIIYNNNFWGNYKTGAAKSQTMWVYSEDAWGVDLTGNFHTGGNGDVKSYPSVIMGSHYGNATRNGSFPMLVRDVKSLSTNWSYTIHSGDELNASYDIWYHNGKTQPKDASGNYIPASYELMIWPYRKGQNPISFKYDANGAVPVAKDVSIGTKKYNVYKGVNKNADGSVQTTVLTFIPTSGTSTTKNTFTANLGDFTREAKKSQYGFIADTHYLLSVQAGYEICKGAKVETTDFDFSYN